MTAQHGRLVVNFILGVATLLILLAALLSVLDDPQLLSFAPTGP